MLNKIILIGNIVHTPESGQTASGVSYTKFNLAVNRPYPNANGEYVADYFDVICYRTLADRCAKYLAKGSKSAVIGSMQRRQYENRQGIKVTTYDVVADEVEFLSPKPNDATEKPAQKGTRQGTIFDKDLTPVSKAESNDLLF